MITRHAPSPETTQQGLPLLALARFEAARFLRHPLTPVGVLFSFFLIWNYMRSGPVLLRDTVLLGGFLLPIAAATLLIWFETSARVRWLEELPDSLSMDRNRIVMGSQLALVAPVLLTAAVEAGTLIYLLAGDPIGSIPLWELLTPPAITAVGGMAGILLGRYLPHPLTAPVAVIGLGVLQFIAAPDRRLGYETPTNNFEWLAPWMPPNAWEPIVIQLRRPAALHLAYLLGLVLVVGLLARRTNARHNAVRLTVAGLFVAVLIGISINMVPVDPDFNSHWQDAVENETCRTVEGIEYCAMPLYESWIPRWQATLAAVQQLLPVQIDAVHQRPTNIGWDNGSGLPRDRRLILATLEWDRPGADPKHSFALALQAAKSALALPAGLVTRAPSEAEIEAMVEENPGSTADTFRGSERTVTCSSIGQARAAVAFWAAAVALPGAEPMVRESLERFSQTSTYVLAELHHLSSTSIGRSDVEVALTLLATPTEDVQKVIGANWSAIANGSMRSAELAWFFGIDPPAESQLDYPAEPCR